MSFGLKDANRASNSRKYKCRGSELYVCRRNRSLCFFLPGLSKLSVKDSDVPKLVMVSGLLFGALGLTPLFVIFCLLFLSLSIYC